jgi:predicted dehydrogenase
MEKLKTAIIGLQHLHLVSYLSHIIACNLDLVAISDDNDSLLEKRKSDFPSNVKYYSDYKNLINSENIGIVFIFSPHYHCPYVVEHTVSKGINIIIEKPIAASHEGGLKIQKTYKKNNVIASVPYVWRFYSVSREIKRILDSGYLGEIKSLEGRYIEGRINHRYIEEVLQITEAFNKSTETDSVIKFKSHHE